MMTAEKQQDIEIKQIAELVVELRRAYEKTDALNKEVMRMCLFCLEPQKTVDDIKKADAMRMMLVEALKSHLGYYKGAWK
jgi:fumarate hydratase class II